jgi:magnesium chelatase family protein
VAVAVVNSRALVGVDAPPVAVEVHLGNGLPAFNLVGLPETEVKESRERVRAALQTARFEFPARRITVNLAPADLPKESGRFDLPIAIGILAATAQLPAPILQGLELAGELALTGALRPIRGALPMALRARAVGRALIVPAENGEEAAMAQGADILAARSLLEVCAHLTGQRRLRHVARPATGPPPALPDLIDVRGQAGAKRALQIAAAGGHSVLLVGPPGTGKSMLAQRLPGLLPEMAEDEALESAALLSLAGLFRPSEWGRRPFRSPHHTASAIALVGGGGSPRPGEISLATGGVLFLDELPEWSRTVLEVLREPLESGRIHIARATRHATFPARFQLVAAMNPCPCGYLGHPVRACRCTPDQVARYRGRVSGPLLDRIDLVVEVPTLPPDALERAPAGPASAALRPAIERARAAQRVRQGCANAHLPAGEVDARCAADAEGRRMLREATSRFALSARAYHRVLKVARTLADLDAADGGGVAVAAEHVAAAHATAAHATEPHVAASHVSATHVAEALAYRAPEAR